MSHLTAHSPATSVLKVRIWGQSGKGPVTSLPRGSLIATYLYYPKNYNPAYHSPVLAGVPDGWSFESADQLKAFSDQLLSTGVATKNDTSKTLAQNAEATLAAEMDTINGPTGINGGGLDALSIRLQKTFVPLVLAEDVTVRKSSPNAAWADTYVSAALSGVTELHGKWCTGRGCNSGLPGVMFQGGEEFWVYLKFVGPKQHCILSAHPDVAARRGCLESYRQICKPLGEFVHPPLRLAFELDSPELISGVYIDPLTSRELRKKAGDFTTTIGKALLTGGSQYSVAQLVQLWKRAFGLDTRARSIDDKDKFEKIQRGVVGLAKQVSAYAKKLTVNTTAFDSAIATFEGILTFTDASTSDTVVSAFATTAASDIRTDTISAVKTSSKIFGPGINSAGVKKDKIFLGNNVPDYVFDFWGFFQAGANTASANQSAALSGHGTALITA